MYYLERIVKPYLVTKLVYMSKYPIAVIRKFLRPVTNLFLIAPKKQG